MISKILNFFKVYQSEVVLCLAIIFLTIISYNLGKMAAYNSLKQPINITETGNLAGVGNSNQVIPAPTSTPKRADYVIASRASSSKLYHFSWCLGAAKILEKNKITFPNEAAAITAGYILASNCSK